MTQNVQTRESRVGDVHNLGKEIWCMAISKRTGILLLKIFCLRIEIIYLLESKLKVFIGMFNKASKKLLRFVYVFFCMIKKL